MTAAHSQTNCGRTESWLKMLKPGLVARARYLKGEQLLRHASLLEIREDGR